MTGVYTPVSYTHLDVYKRQVIRLPNGRNFEIKGDKIKKEIFDIINISSSKYDTITISDIKVRTNSSFQGCIRPAPIQIEIF